MVHTPRFPTILDLQAIRLNHSGRGHGIKPPGRIQETHSSYHHRIMKAVVLLVCVALVASKPTGDEDVLGSVVAVVRSCSENDVALCLKVCLCFVSCVYVCWVIKRGN